MCPEVILPDNWGCCGASGDRGFIFSGSCLIRQPGMNGMKLAMNRSTVVILWHWTCEIAMQDHIEQPYESIVYRWMRQFRPGNVGMRSSCKYAWSIFFFVKVIFSRIRECRSDSLYSFFLFVVIMLFLQK